MKRTHRNPSLLLACLFSALAAPSFAEEEPLPPPLQGATHVRVAVANCKGEPKKRVEIYDPAQVQRLVAEMEKQRNPDGIAATKFSCDTAVTFMKGNQSVALVHVFPCSAIEQAPVSGKRYFQYSAGFSQLPELSRLVKSLGKGVECR